MARIYILLGILLLGIALAWYWVVRPHEKAGLVYPVVECSFQPEDGENDPYAREYWGWITAEHVEGIWVPAFYDGNAVWKLRFSPRQAGHYSVKLYEEENGLRRALEPQMPSLECTVKGRPVGAGLVRINPQNPRHFCREDGSAYYPVGMNIGWDMGDLGSVVQFMERLRAAGGNWTRIWMTHWDDKNLDWSQQARLKPGEWDLAAAEKWDRIVEAADRLQIPFQMVLQHHGQYSSSVNAAWNENPWNARNGGFLEKPEEFFTDAEAKQLTRRKLRYIVARWGYSPSIMAWELFNEVEFTDAFRTEGGREAVRAWHEEMAAYIRSIDPYGHLITTSAPSLDDPLWRMADYYQQHLYPPDVLAGFSGFSVDPDSLARPVFYGESGSMDEGGQSHGEGASVLKKILLGSLFSGSAGTAQYWSWDQVEREKLYSLISVAVALSDRAGLGEGNWHKLDATISTSGRTDMQFGPGQRWDSVLDPQMNLTADGRAGQWTNGFSATLRPIRGSGERPGTDRVSFQVDLDRATEWRIQVDEVSGLGAVLEMWIDSDLGLSKAWEAAAGPDPIKPEDEFVSVMVPEGKHVLRVKSSGADYLRLRSVRLQGYSPELNIHAMIWGQKVLGWVFRPPGHGEAASGITGSMCLRGMPEGRYRITWYDTDRAGAPKLKEEFVSVTGTQLRVQTPAIRSDLAFIIEP